MKVIDILQKLKIANEMVSGGNGVNSSLLWRVGVVPVLQVIR